MTPLELVLAALAVWAATVAAATWLLTRSDRHQAADIDPAAPAVADFTAHPDADEITALFAGVLAETDQP